MLMLLQARPQAEQFEDRLVPDTYLWNAGTQGYFASNNPANWLVNGQPTMEEPGSDDTLLFDGTQDASIKILTPEVAGIEIQVGYSGVIDLAVEGGAKYHSFEVTGSFKMAGGKIQDINFSTGTENANLLLTKTSTFTWTAGEIAKVNISLGASDNHNVTGSISGTVTLYDSSLDNYGTLAVSGTVDSGFGVYNFITNRAGGTFEAKTGFDLQDPDGWLKNEGLLRFTSTGTAVVNSRFYNNGGTVRVESGTAQFHQLAEQTSGTFELRNGTADVTSNDGEVLKIYDGTLTGAGTIDGNLNLGYDGRPATGVTIRPGIDGAVGKIDITQSWQMFSANGLTHIKVVDDKNYSEITAGGWAKLAGTLMIENLPTYWPAVNTTISFLTAGLGFDGTDFGYKDMTYWGSWPDPGMSGKKVHWSLKPPTGSTYSMVSEFVPGSGPPGKG
jgi:hypothetical protein